MSDSKHTGPSQDDLKVAMIEAIAGAIYDAPLIEDPLAETGRAMLEHVLNVSL